MKNFYRLSLQTLTLLFVTQLCFAQISGLTWQDYNANSIKESSEKPQAQIRVKAFDRSGNMISSAVTDASGSYKLDIAGSQHVRVEFSDIPEGYVTALAKATTQFVTSPAEISLGIYHPATFSGDHPFAVQTVFASGDLSTKTPEPISSLVKYSAFPYSGMIYSAITHVKNTGSVWGLAYDRQRRILFSSSLAKRHSALGSQGPGGIYATFLDNNQTRPFVNLDALGFKTVPFPLDRQLSTELAGADHDSLMFSQVGKIGLGGIDISDDSRYLFTVNLYDRHLYRIKLSVDASPPKVDDVIRFPLPLTGFTGGEPRPFAVKYYNGKVYVGMVCDAQISQKATDLMAYVYEIQADEIGSGAANFKEVTRFSLDYPRGYIDYNVKGWFPWTDNYQQTVPPYHTTWMIYPQPMLADIEFDSDGSLIISLMDRLGHQTGNGSPYRNKEGYFSSATGISGGDVLRLNKDVAGYHMEQNGKSGANVSLGKDNGQGPAGGEFYYQDNFVSGNIEWHQESATGGLAILPASKSVMVSIREPDSYTTGGARWFNNETGASMDAFAVFPTSMRANYFWKPNNVGDIELITPLPPIEIGDRVWADNNGNGLQDADEAASPGILLQLYRNGQYLGSTVSGNDGRYAFNAGNVGESIKSRTNYQVRIPLNQAGRTLSPTQVSAGDSRELDSDAAITSADYASISVLTKNPGENILDLDIGFQCIDKPQVTAKFDCQNNVVKLSLSGYNQNQHFDLTPGATYLGTALYTSASAMPNSGLILEQALQVDKPFIATARIFAESGCFQDLFLTTEGRSGCAYIPESLFTSEPYTLIIYPNPSSGPVNIAYKGATTNAKVRIQLTDNRGNILKSTEVSSQDGYYLNGFDLSNLTVGLYIISVTDQNKMVTKTFAKF
ncbi:SdrD B-like domain-containing protein [Dyadobacter frigoris]|uniref:T9SS type A sorting domain-containing protein n=1 Tax=Dyadobacter frigoris TaxID=2576211 RepID=A0A4U6D1F1_9BACT|nr:SdrD B-like domain-containing protein [Dyadobacter frigoris]TKT87624.1 T9SS type A sorting domain-containing protein [Dyadobacter frigoris]GLU52685.1 hypothetical protein Dfri01_21460 [Dyadobacter frigoris]